MNDREQKDYILVKTVLFALMADRVIFPMELVFGKQEADKMKPSVAIALAAWWDEWTATEDFVEEHGTGGWKII